MKKVVALLAGMILGASSPLFAADAGVTQNTQNTSKVAVVNVQQVLLKSARVSKVNNQLQSQFKPRQEKLAAQQKSLQDQVDKLNKESSTMAKKDRDAMEKKINDEKANFLKDATAFQKDVSAEQNKAMQTILAQLNKIITDIAKKNDYSMVLDSQAVVYASDATDITSQVSKEFNSEG